MIERIIAYMQAQGHEISTKPAHLNIVYIEGMNPDGTLNPDTADGWNDLRIVFDHTEEGQPRILHIAVATTEPGRSATFATAAMRRGGVFRIAFGQHTAWEIGHHKSPEHPALVQRAPVPGHRDANRDGIRPGDKIGYGIGINQHGTRPGYDGTNVGNWSEGCLVGRDWEQHIAFIELLKTDPRYQKKKKYKFTTTVIPGDKIQ